MGIYRYHALNILMRLGLIAVHILRSDFQSVKFPNISGIGSNWLVFNGLASMEGDSALDIRDWGTCEESTKDHPALKLMAVIAERDVAILERDTAIAEKKAAYAERDVALLQREVAISDRNSALLERDAAAAALGYSGHINLTGQRGPLCGTLVGIKVQTVGQTFPAPVSEALLAEQPKQTNQADNNIKGQKEPPSNKVFNGCELITPVLKIQQNMGDTTGQETNGLLAVVKHEKKDQDYTENKITFDTSALPIPVCSCTGVPQQCYRWGSGGWQSACCTTSISIYPLPLNPNKRGARLGGRKMSGGAFAKLLARLIADGYSLEYPVDLKNHWAKHGTNRYIRIQ